MKKIILIRHGESTWNKENRFTGWADVELTPQGKQEAREAGKRLLAAGYEFDLAFTSVLKRAQDTLKEILQEMQLETIPIIKSWQLNERHYGSLTGLNKAEIAKKYGEDQVHIWRRSYDIPPPPMSENEAKIFKDDKRYADLSAEQFPLTECLKDTVNRVLPFWHRSVVPMLLDGRQIIIAAHGNSLRGLVKYLSGISDENIISLNIPNGIPLVYELNEQLIPTNAYYLSGENVNLPLKL